MSDPHVEGSATHRWVTVAAGPGAARGELRLAVTEMGPPDSPAWVVAHGVGSSARFLAAALAGPLAAAGRRLVVYDTRGHGSSDPARAVVDHHLDVLVQDLAAVSRSTDSEVEVVGGVSLGAHTAVRAVAQGAVVPSGAVLACLPAWIGTASAGHGPHAAIAAEVRRDGVAGMLARLARESGLPDWLRATLLTEYPRHDVASLTAALEALDGGEAPELAEVARLPVPLAVVGWPDDPGHPLAVAEAWRAAAPTATLERLALSALDDGLEVMGRAMLQAVTTVVGDVSRR